MNTTKIGAIILKQCADIYFPFLTYKFFLDNYFPKGILKSREIHPV